VAIPVTAVPGLALTADYRLVGVHNAGDLNSVFYNKVDNVVVKGGIGLQKDIFVQLVTVGVAYAFGVTAAPPPPMAVAPPAPAPMAAHGYTDNSATHPGARGEHYNQGLSVRRAQSVKSELVRDRVPTSAIDINGYGESSPLVQTAADTRGPQNRRVEIILH